MTLIEQALEAVQRAIIVIDAKQWREIKQTSDTAEIVSVAMESQALQRVALEIKKQLEGIEK